MKRIATKQEKRTRPVDTNVVQIPVFISRPRVLNSSQKHSLQKFEDILALYQLYPKTLDDSTDYPSGYPLQQVYHMARTCFGAVILGFEQLVINSGVLFPQTRNERLLDDEVKLSLPTPWNHFEAGILFGMGLPLLIFKEPRVNHGIFDTSAHGLPVHEMLPKRSSEAQRREFSETFLKFQARVRAKFHSEIPQIV
jgi:hypothetical protein